MSRTSLGSRLEDAFRQATAKRPDLHEDELVRELLGSFGALSAVDGLATEHHAGQRTYVDFQPREGLAGDERRAELADALLVCYRPSSPPAVRLTLLQARRRAGPLPDLEGPLPSARARTNVYHWDLLHRRPAISPVGNVTPPASLLADARSPSIASFAFFHRPTPERWHVALCSADVVQPWGEWPPAERPRRTARFPHVTAWRWTEGRREALAAARLADLGDLVADRAVGAPLELPAETEHDRLVASWLAAILARAGRKAEGQAQLAEELHELSTGALAAGGLVDADSRTGAPPLVLVRVEG